MPPDRSATPGLLAGAPRRSRAPAHSPRWVSIGRACEILGVNPATLRAWTDAGKIRAFLTPGGHRRYEEGDLLAFAGRAQAPPSPLLGALLLDARDRYGSLASRSLLPRPWFQHFDDSSRTFFRILGNSFLQLADRYLNAAGRHDQERALAEGREVANQWGTRAARIGLSLAEATEAFLLCRQPVLEAFERLMARGPVARTRTDRLLKRFNQFMDQALLAMVAAHEASRADSPGHAHDDASAVTPAAQPVTAAPASNLDPPGSHRV